MDATKRIYYVSAPCGAGKTRGAVSYIKANISRKNFIVVVPTTLMVEQWSVALAEQGIVAEPITNNTANGHVKRTIIEKQNKFKPQGHVQIITWNAYADLPYRPEHKNIQVIVDEVPQTDKYFPWNISGHIEDLANVLKVERPINDKVSVVEASDRDALELSLMSRGDDVDEIFREFKRHVLSPNRTVFVDSAAYERVFHRHSISPNDYESNRVSFLSMLNPCLLEGVILLGANITASILYHWMTRMHDVRFIEHAQIGIRMEPQFPRKSRLKVYHYFEGETLASKYRFNCVTLSGKKVIDEMDRLAVQVFGDEPFLYVANRNRAPELLKSCPNAMRLPVDSRGLNSYREYDNIYFSAALNREPKHIRMMGDLGLSSKEVYRATACEQAYQAIFRTSLRDKSAQHEITAIVPDFITATYVSGLVGGATITKLDIDHAWSTKALTPMEKKQRARAKKALNKVFESEWVPKTFINVDGRQNDDYQTANTLLEQQGELATLVEFCNDILNEVSPEGGNQVSCYVTFHENLQACEENEHRVIKMTPMEFVRFLKTQWRSVQDDKHSRALFNPGKFCRRQGGSGWRTLVNFQSSSMLVLDFDGGNLSPEQFWVVFGPNAGPGRQLNFALYNSFNRSPEQPNRFHAVIFYRRQAQSIEEHRAVFDGIVRRLEEEGFNTTGMGLDVASATGVQSFYVPCTNRSYPEMAFFESHGVTARALASAVDPSLYARTKLASKSERRTWLQSSSSWSPPDLEPILSSLRGLTSDRHKPLFAAATKLSRAGLSPCEIEAVLIGVLGEEPKIKKKIRDANRSISKYRMIGGGSSGASANNAPG